MASASLTAALIRVRLARARAQTLRHGGLEGPYLPEGSGDAQSPEELRALEVYEERMARFELGLSHMGRRPRRANFNDYTAKNCEECWAGRAKPATVHVEALAER